MSVNLRIRQLTMEGLPIEQHEAVGIAVAVERELKTLMGMNGSGQRKFAATRPASRDTDEMRIGSGAALAEIGKEIAARIFVRVLEEPSYTGYLNAAGRPASKADPQEPIEKFLAELELKNAKLGRIAQARPGAVHEGRDRRNGRKPSPAVKDRTYRSKSWGLAPHHGPWGRDLGQRATSKFPGMNSDPAGRHRTVANPVQDGQPKAVGVRPGSYRQAVLEGQSGGYLDRLIRQVRGPTRVRRPAEQTSPPQADFLRVFRWPRFVNRGESVCAPGVTLGTNPDGQLLNAMELVFTETETAADLRRRQARGGYSRYRVRQTIAEDVWERVNGRWFLLSRTPAGTSDDPAADLQCWDAPTMRTVDTPGWSMWLGVGPSTRRLRVAGGGQSDPQATVVWVQQNFFTWVEGEKTFSGGWERVSVKYPWHNSLRLERATPTSDWRPAAQTRIQGGHMDFGPNPETERE